MKEIIIIEHPYSRYYLTELRNELSDTKHFSETLDRLSYIMAGFAYSSVAIKQKSIQTPLEKTKGYYLPNKVVLVPILRAGTGLLKGFVDLAPDPIISHIGIYRNEETLEPVKYYFRFPKKYNKNKIDVYILDPMIATGGSMIYTLKVLKDLGLKSVKVVSVICAPEGLEAIDKEFSGKDFKIEIYTCSIDKKLNKSGYILPGLGDAGDRYFGT